MGLMPENIASFGSEIDRLTAVITWITGSVLVLAEILLLFIVLRFRRPSSPKAKYLTGTKWGQARWVLIPVMIVVILDFYIDTRTSHAWETIKGSVPSKSDFAVRITGQQFAWSFTYPGPDGVLGTADDFTRQSELHVPIDSTVVFELESRDVVHSFWVPSMRLKQDAVPGRTIRGWFKAQKLGRYDIACAEICGVGHAMMAASLHVHDKAEFEREFARPPAPVAANDARGRGEALILSKGCVGCHTSDGTPRVGPTYKGLFGRKEIVTTGGVEHEVVVDEDYLRKSILDPGADLVKGFPPAMPSQRGLLNDAELADIIAYLKSTK